LRFFSHRIRFLSVNHSFGLLIAGMAVLFIAGGCSSTGNKLVVLNEGKQSPAVPDNALQQFVGPRMIAAPASQSSVGAETIDTADDADTVSEDPGDIIADARMFCRDSNYAAADSLLRIAVKSILVMDAQCQSDRFPTSRYIDDIISIYDEKMPKSYALPDEIAASAFQWQVGRSLDSIQIPSADSASIASLSYE